MEHYRYAEQFPYYDPLDPDYLEDVVRRVFGPVSRHYFRPRILGRERLPTDGPAILSLLEGGGAAALDSADVAEEDEAADPTDVADVARVADVAEAAPSIDDESKHRSPE